MTIPQILFLLKWVVHIASFFYLTNRCGNGESCFLKAVYIGCINRNFDAAMPLLRCLCIQNNPQAIWISPIFLIRIGRLKVLKDS